MNEITSTTTSFDGYSDSTYSFEEKHVSTSKRSSEVDSLEKVKKVKGTDVLNEIDAEKVSKTSKGCFSCFGK